MNELIEMIALFLKENSHSRLRGRAFDVSDSEGRLRYAEWLAGELVALEEFAEKKGLLDE